MVSKTSVASVNLDIDGASESNLSNRSHDLLIPSYDKCCVNSSPLATGPSGILMLVGIDVRLDLF